MSSLQAGHGFSNPAVSARTVGLMDVGSRRTFNAYDYVTDPDPPPYLTATAAAVGRDDDEYLKPSVFSDYWGDDYYETVKMIDSSEDCTVKYANNY